MVVPEKQEEGLAYGEEVVDYLCMVKLMEHIHFAVHWKVAHKD